MHARTARPLWNQLQNDDAVPTKIENAFQNNWVILNTRIAPRPHAKMMFECSSLVMNFWRLRQVEKICGCADREAPASVADRRVGCGYRSAYATWDIDGQWNYERGRAWAVSAPRSVELRRNELSPAAIRWFHEDIL